MLRGVKWFAPGSIVRKGCSSQQRLHFRTHPPERHHSTNFFRPGRLFRGRTPCPQSERALVSGKGAGEEHSNPENVAGTRADGGPRRCFVSRSVRKTLTGSSRVSLPFRSHLDRNRTEEGLRRRHNQGHRWLWVTEGAAPEHGAQVPCRRLTRETGGWHFRVLLGSVPSVHKGHK